MRDKPIGEGDLVQVVRPVSCGCEDRYMGAMFRVQKIRKSQFPWCIDCGADVKQEMVAEHDGCLFELSRLKRIPPLDELESQQRHEELMNTVRDILTVGR